MKATLSYLGEHAVSLFFGCWEVQGAREVPSEPLLMVLDPPPSGVRSAMLPP